MVASPQSFASPEAAGWLEQLETTFRSRSLIHLAAGSPVPLLSDHVWLVVRGMVRLSTCQMSGDEALLGLAGPNEPFGRPLSAVDPYDAITLTASDLLCLRWDEIIGDPQLSSLLLQALARRYRQAEALLALMGLRRVEERLRAFLELLAADYGQPVEAGVRIGVRLTHQDLANALGSTRVTITRLLGQLREEGWLVLESGRHLVVAHRRR
ncbi:MAG: Crp/Fnr family transcriptional regulator [Cyanobacteriota bacterium]|jgi:CRP-like cAMP-binding protein|nr:Crp/Fnr family transcriptional regulator [Cyanobacteriota bacterium]